MKTHAEAVALKRKIKNSFFSPRTNKVFFAIFQKSINNNTHTRARARIVNACVCVCVCVCVCSFFTLPFMKIQNVGSEKSKQSFSCVTSMNNNNLFCLTPFKGCLGNLTAFLTIAHLRFSQSLKLLQD